MTTWGIVFGLVFVALMLSVSLQLCRGYYDARGIDVEQTWLRDHDQGSRLSLALRLAPRGGQLVHELVPPRGDVELYTVIVQLSATGEPARGGEPDALRHYVVELPRLRRVRVVDKRFARDEVLIVERSELP